MQGRVVGEAEIVAKPDDAGEADLPAIRWSSTRGRLWSARRRVLPAFHCTKQDRALHPMFGFFCYATFELTSMSLLKHWTWPVVIVDVAWGLFVTAVSSTAGLLIANGSHRESRRF